MEPSKVLRYIGNNGKIHGEKNEASPAISDK